MIKHRGSARNGYVYKIYQHYFLFNRQISCGRAKHWPDGEITIVPQYYCHSVLTVQEFINGISNDKA